MLARRGARNAELLVDAPPLADAPEPVSRMREWPAVLGTFRAKGGARSKLVVVVGHAKSLANL